jgi:probable F420-dependent oxidoreductase
MKVNASLPFDRLDGDFIGMDAVVEISTTLERLGFSGVAVTDHPCPSARWLDAGGHHAQDPFVTLSLIAAHTQRLRLQTGALVLPYRNPFITARAVASLDAFSNGRVTLGVGAGYMKAEYRALGVDFDARNDLVDEYIQAMKTAWTGANFAFKGAGYEALGNRVLPAPAQRPHPPLLIGGNSKRAIRRAAELGDGWNPFFTPASLSATARTAAMSNDLDLAAGMRYLREECEKIGRERPCEVVLGGLTHPGERWTPSMLVDRIGEYECVGVKGVAMHFDGATRGEYCDNAERFANDVLRPIG